MSFFLRICEIAIFFFYLLNGITSTLSSNSVVCSEICADGHEDLKLSNITQEHFSRLIQICEDVCQRSKQK
ncbi:UNVERIFIED_CONTAM: hypothetical protein RMT77_015510 [Armadillidium vulgare]